MIREANKFDLPKLVELIKQFAIEYDNVLTSQPINWSKTHAEAVISHILAGLGFVLIDEENNGILVACKLPSFWIPNMYQLHEVLLRADNKITTIKLIKEYIKRAQEMIDKGEIANAIIAAHPSVDYEKLGLRQLEVNWEIR